MTGWVMRKPYESLSKQDLIRELDELRKQMAARELAYQEEVDKFRALVEPWAMAVWEASTKRDDSFGFGKLAHLYRPRIARIIRDGRLDEGSPSRRSGIRRP